MSGAKKQHYVPRFYLKSFSTQQNNEYFTNCFDKSDLSHFKVNIKEIGCENYFYGISPAHSQEVEKILADYDSQFTKVYNKLTSIASISCLNWKEKEVFAQFITIQELRTREMREHLRDMVKTLNTQLSDKPLSAKLEKDLKRVNTEEGIRIIHSGFILETLLKKNNLVDMLVDLKWILFENNTTIPFWTSDHPVNRYNPIDLSPYGNLGTLCRGIQIFFPLTPKLEIAFCDPIEYFFMPEKSSCEKDNLLFYNTLQARSNARHIFSINSDFSVAKKWLRQSPESMPLDRKRISTDVRFNKNYNDKDYFFDPTFRYFYANKYME